MTDKNAPFTSGFVALVGRPNAGKSTLLNAIMGEKLAITSPVAQTTRRRMRAVVNTDHSQLVIIDTPGLHKPKDALGSELNKSALGELADADVVAFLVDATKPVGRGDEWVASHVARADADYKLLVLTKADVARPEQVAAQLEAARTCPRGRAGSRRTWTSTPRPRSSSRSSCARSSSCTCVRSSRTPWASSATTSTSPTTTTPPSRPRSSWSARGRRASSSVAGVR